MSESAELRAAVSSSSWFARNRWRYPDDWEAIARAAKEATGWRCEACGAPHGPPPHVLTTDHLHHDPENRDAVLLVLCQRDHLRRQGLNPPARTREEALRRLRARIEAERTQLALWSEEEEGGDSDGFAAKY